MIVGPIAAITEPAISYSSSLFDVHTWKPLLGEKELFRSWMTIGKYIIVKTTNTLYFSFVGSYLALFLWFRDLSYSFGEAPNANVPVSEVLSLFVLDIGVTCLLSTSTSPRDRG